MIANDPSFPLAERRTAVLQLFLHHVRPGMTLAEVGALLDRAPWLDDADVTLVEDVGGALPVHPGEGRTIARVAVLPGPGTTCFVFLALAGDVEATEVGAALRGERGSEAEIVEVGVHPKDGICAD